MSESKTRTPDARRVPRFSGLITFLRAPKLKDVETGIDWAIYGAPFDGAVTYRPGARLGPRAVREASQFVRPFHVEHRVNVFEAFSVADAGDSPVAPFSCAETQDLIAEFAGALVHPGARPFAVGGDHSIALGNIRAAWRGAGSPDGGLALIHFDSHIDTVDIVWGESHTHASVFRRAFEEGVVNPDKTISIGVKGPLNRADDWDYAREAGVQVISFHDYQRFGPERVRSFIERLGDEPAYCSFDIDVVDPAFAPGTGTPSVGGFTSAEAIAALRGFAGIALAGADVVEVLPDRDPAGVTSLLAAQIMLEILALDAVARSG